MGVLAGLIGAAVAGGLSAWVRVRPASASIDDAGWRHLKPGPLLMLTLAGCLTLTGIFMVIALSGGSKLPDAASQNRYLALLIIAFGCMTGFVAWAGFWVGVRWKRDEIAASRLVGRSTYRISTVRHVSIYDSLGLAVVKFDDGSALRFSVWLRGSDELLTILRGTTGETG